MASALPRTAWPRDRATGLTCAVPGEIGVALPFVLLIVGRVVGVHGNPWKVKKGLRRAC